MTATGNVLDDDLVSQERLIDECERAIGTVGRSLDLPPNALQDRVRQAKRAVVRVRDDLIHALREASSPAQREPFRAALDDANVVLSLLIGVEYPAGGVQRSVVEQARDRLRVLLDEKLRPGSRDAG